jgi:tRNA pseudouridine55 synthase
MKKDEINRLFVVNKPSFISSNHYLNKIKRKYNTKKAGFSGTLDPFANGTLIIGLGKYTRLFQFLAKAPKVYQATLFLGAVSDTFDLEGITKIDTTLQQDTNKITKIFEDLQGTIEYIPPKYSAKKINGIRAYTLARQNKDFDLKKITSTIYELKLLNYTHPFLSFEAKVSEGTYIRSIGQMIVKKLGINGSLSYLKRLNEGAFFYKDEKSLNPLKYLNIEENFFLDDVNIIDLGQKIDTTQFKNKNNGQYYVCIKDYFSIIEINKNNVKYIINKIPLGEHF